MILSEIDRNEQTTQTTQTMLADIAGLSAAGVNAYVKKLCSDGYLVMHGNNKRTVYRLTDKGSDYKRYLLVSFMAELIDLSTSVSAQIKQMLLPLVEDGEKRVYFYGAGETGQVFVRMAAAIPRLIILGFVDDNPALHDTLVTGYSVFPLETALQQPFDKIIISVFPDDNPRKKLLTLIDEDKIAALSELDTKIWRK